MLSLVDILHEVPLLLDLLPAKSLAALVAVNQAHRRQVHNHVSRVAIPDHEHVQTLFRGVWPRVKSWQIGDRLQTWPDGTHSDNYSSTALIKLRFLTLCEGSLTAAGVAAQLHHVSQSTLQICRIRSVELSCAGIYAFCSHTWPALLQLYLSNYKLDTVAISHLAAASWPCLTTLHLSCTGLTHAAFQQLCLGCWPALTKLDVSQNNLTSGSICLLAPAPIWSMTDWAAQLTVLDLSGDSMTSARSLTASVIEQLTKIYWPCLERLCLRWTVPNLDVILHLVQGRWPKLSMLNISGAAIEAPALQMLAQAPWTHLTFLHLTANLQDTAVSEQFIAGREHQDQQLLRYLQLQDAQPWSITMCGRSSPLSNIESSGYMQLPKSFAHWLELNIHVWQV